MSLDIKQNKQTKEKIKQAIEQITEQFSVGFSLATKIDTGFLDFPFQRLVIIGMGGSALPADLLQNYRDHLLTKNHKSVKVSILSHQSYGLPAASYDQALNLICSYSGNTEETISALREAIAQRLPVIGISGGGEVEKICLQYKLPHLKLPFPYDGFQPRMALGYFLAIFLQLLIKAKKFPDITTEVLEDILLIKEESKQQERLGRQLATKMAEALPLIYAPFHFQVLGRLWKIKFNENSKKPAFWNFFPEVDHNEIAGFSYPQTTKYFIFMLRDFQDNPRNLLRYDLTAQLLAKRGITSEIVDIPPGGLTYRLFSTLALGDWLTYSLAWQQNIDPFTTPIISELKQLLHSEE